MTTLKELIKRRNDTYAKMTEGLLDAIPNIISGVEMFANQTSDYGSRLEWEDVLYGEHYDIILLVGTTVPHIGDGMRLADGTTSEVTESTLEYFKTPLRLAIPYDLAENGSAEDICEFIARATDNQEQYAEAAAQSSLDESDFDLDSLTEDQRKSLELHGLLGGETIE